MERLQLLLYSWINNLYSCSCLRHDSSNSHLDHRSLGVQKPTTPAPLKEDILYKGLMALSHYRMADDDLQEKDTLD